MCGGFCSLREWVWSQSDSIIPQITEAYSKFWFLLALPASPSPPVPFLTALTVAQTQSRTWNDMCYLHPSAPVCPPPSTSSPICFIYIPFQKLSFQSFFFVVDWETKGDMSVGRIHACAFPLCVCRWRAHVWGSEHADKPLIILF